MTLNSKKTAFLILAVFLFIFDRYLKYLALDGVEFNILGDWLKFDFTPNPYIAFSIPFGGDLLIGLVTVVTVMVLYVIYILYKKANFSHLLAFFIISLGSLSNLIDRFRFSFVVDYIDLRYFTVFNFADAMISLAVVWIILNSSSLDLTKR